LGNVGHRIDFGTRRILVVTGLASEAKIARGSMIRTVCSGGNAGRLHAGIIAALNDNIIGMISFGVAGGLSPDMAVGTVVLASTIVSSSERYGVDPTWLDRLASKLPKAVHAPIVGVDRPVAEAGEKARLGARTGAAVVDMESHIAARMAAVHGFPFAALRIILDPVHLTLPPAALVGTNDDGRLNIAGVLRALVRTPSQLPSLIQTAIAANSAFAALKRSRGVLDAGFCFPALEG
jgi:adenosylhomocysteine nucleosidase